MKNPVAKNDASNKTALSIFTKNCLSCHGKTGQGKGVKVAKLMNSPGDFTQSRFQDLSAGAIFYRIITGREEMPKLENLLMMISGTQ